MRNLLLIITSVIFVACSIIQNKCSGYAKLGVVKIDVKSFKDTVRFVNETDLSRFDIKNLSTRLILKTNYLAENKGVLRYLYTRDSVPIYKHDPITGEELTVVGSCEAIIENDLVYYYKIRPLNIILTALPSDTILVEIESMGKTINSYPVEYKLNSYGKFVHNELVEFKLGCNPLLIK